ncbi:MAG: hypothetical protein ACTSYC_10055 [Promethearchaeota archaeon]
MALTIAEILQGSLNLVFVIISFIIGLTILSKYRIYKKREYILIGLIWMGICTPWLHGAIAIIVYIFNPMIIESESFITMRFIITYTFIPIIVVLWFIVFTDFLYRNKQKLIVSIIAITSLTFEVLFYTFLIIDRENLIGYFGAPFLVIYSPFMRITYMFFLGIAFITFMIFARESLKSNEKEIQWKGRFLIIAFILFTLSAVLDSIAIFLTQPSLIIMTRIFLMSSAIFFYFGWILPDRLKKVLIKEE